MSSQDAAEQIRDEIGRQAVWQAVYRSTDNQGMEQEAAGRVQGLALALAFLTGEGGDTGTPLMRAAYDDVRERSLRSASKWAREGNHEREHRALAAADAAQELADLHR